MSTDTGSLSTKVRKLDEDFQAMFKDVGEILKTQQTHGKKLNQLQSDVAGLKTDVAGLKTDVAGLKTDVAGLKTDVAELKTDVAELKTDVAELKTVLRTDLVDVKSILGVIVSRLPER